MVYSSGYVDGLEEDIKEYQIQLALIRELTLEEKKMWEYWEFGEKLLKILNSHTTNDEVDRKLDTKTEDE